MLKHAIAFCCDQAALPFAAFSAARILDQVQTPSFDLFIASEGELRLPPWLLEQGARGLRIAPGRDLELLAQAGEGRLPKSAYLRLWLAERLADEGYERLLYLDYDTFPLVADLASLFALNLQGKAVAAVRDLSQWWDISRHAPEFEANGRPEYPYLNSGVLLIDIAAWLSAEVTEHCVQEATRKPVTRSHDQAFLNLALEGDWAELHPCWNWHMTRKHHGLQRWVRPKILHFAGPRKPWMPTGQREHHFFARKAYADFLERRFPELSFAPGGPMPWPKCLYQDAVALWVWKELQPYLQRFRTPRDVLFHDAGLPRTGD